LFYRGHWFFFGHDHDSPFFIFGKGVQYSLPSTYLQFHYLNLVKKLSEGKWYPFPVTEESGFIMDAVLAFD
jgi:hypothetical protein